MKNLITFFIKYDIAVNIIIIGFVIFGYMGIKSMKSSFFPLTESKNISISVAYPGASPQEIEEGVVLKIEDNLKGVVGVERVTSVSRENSASLNVEIEVGRNIDVVLSDVKNAVDRVPSFPVGIEPPIIAKIETTNQTISFTLSGDDIPLKTLKQYARQIEKDLRRIEGISQIQLTGFPEEEIEIAVRENDLRAYNLTFSEVSNAVSQSNLLITGGNIKTAEEDFLIRARNRNYYADEIDGIIVRADKAGNIIRLKDIASVKDIWNENPDRIFFNKKIAIELNIQNTNNEDLLGNCRKCEKLHRAIQCQVR
ncbi:MAG: efflux RND transporter permease subunit [Flavobacteriaceae bacterium]|nr:efflux RND transporter permease subunit [Flavobacteriaceae bacterium]